MRTVGLTALRSGDGLRSEDEIARDHVCGGGDRSLEIGAAIAIHVTTDDTASKRN